MTYETLIVEIGDGFIGSITLNRPQNFNTFNIPLALELDQALKSLDGNPEVHVVLIKGAGKNFCAGIDVSDWRHLDKRLPAGRDRHVGSPVARGPGDTRAR
jgi:enoyl-CoA hydratase/carnithine racemase